jgi:hypothetical protein
MKKSIFVLTALCLCFSLTLAFAGHRDRDDHGPSSPPPQGYVSPSGGSLNANQIAQNLSMITGVAISPLLGVGVVGAWQYYHTPPEQRAKLSWYSDPLFFIPALLLVSRTAAGSSCPPR